MGEACLMCGRPLSAPRALFPTTGKRAGLSHSCTHAGQSFSREGGPQGTHMPRRFWLLCAGTQSSSGSLRGDLQRESQVQVVRSKRGAHRNGCQLQPPSQARPPCFLLPWVAVSPLKFPSFLVSPYLCIGSLQM